MNTKTNIEHNKSQSTDRGRRPSLLQRVAGRMSASVSGSAKVHNDLKVVDIEDCEAGRKDALIYYASEENIDNSFH